VALLVFQQIFLTHGLPCKTCIGLKTMPSHPLCMGRHIWIRCAMQREALSPPCPGKKGHHVPSPFSCTFKSILTTLVQSDRSMKPNVRWTGIVLQIGCSSGANQHHPLTGVKHHQLNSVRDPKRYIQHLQGRLTETSSSLRLYKSDFI